MNGVVLLRTMGTIQKQRQILFRMQIVKNFTVLLILIHFG